ncbi:hypothetical protein CTI12_AA191820 [Artemisia annua]|uniref:Uncharacterized protein n=1 Tax=Artemisia annua TaxID=35608 RepID=A0A2U1P571_ARTAN|nr:hypothetical protein CTI12_AA191820 [Artemisia annua]
MSKNAGDIFVKSAQNIHPSVFCSPCHSPSKVRVANLLKDMNKARLMVHMSVQTLEHIIRRLQEDNTQMRAQFERDMQIQVQRKVEHQVLAHMQQRELEANARELAREREWQQRMNDINLVLKKFMDSRPDP